MKYKVGDKVICIPGYCDTRSGDSTYGGLGYGPNKVFVIRGFDGDVLWPQGGGHGVYVYAVRLYEPISINRNIKKLKFI
jgi:hypothetical protein